MSNINIDRYYNEVEKIIRFGGSRNESAIRAAFFKLLNSYCESKDFLLIPELDYKTKLNTTVNPDGTVKDALRLDWGYWESKDTYDDLNTEIEKKIEKGYPIDNIIFEDSETAVLIQGGEEIFRISIKDDAGLDRLLTTFINYERPEVWSFREAIKKFQEDIPTILDSLRKMISEQAIVNTKFQKSRDEFLRLCKEVINPAVNQDDVREMMIQHMLTDEIFTHVYGESHFHKENNIAHQLQLVIDTFFTGQVRREILSSIESYYKVIKREASNITNHKEKQKFLKVVYENFYKVYNPKGADRLGIIYTPDEIVNFMIDSTNYLLNKHFGKILSDNNVEILDPATGTGTFVTDIIDYIPEDKLAYKYENEIHANEVAILPYYVANLNIEYTFKQKTGKYKEYKNICFVDTLDNLGFGYKGRQEKLFGISAENLERIKRQNERDITVIIGNPPYNANQQNFNDFNKNREYPEIDERIKRTFVKESTAQKTKVYDMYARFYRWAMDRIKDNGIISFITNRSFIDSKTFDGFRKIIEDNFQFYYIIDTKSDVRQNPKIAGTTHNVFGIQTGVAIGFLVKKSDESLKKCQIYYYSLRDELLKQEKLNWLQNNTIDNIPFNHIQPSKQHNWINLADSDFNNLIPLIEKSVKAGKGGEAIFKLFSLGIVTARDEWVYDYSAKNLEKKVKFFCNEYEKDYNIIFQNKDSDLINPKVKYTSEIIDNIKRGNHLIFDSKNIRIASFRPFIKKYTYCDKIIIHRLYQQELIFPLRTSNKNILICVNIGNKIFNVLAVDSLPDYHLNGDCNCIPMYVYNENNDMLENITDWGLEQFINHYQDKSITKQTIFHYIYGVLHNPFYKEKYKLNLRREFPRIPFYNEFWKWSNWGKDLMDVHINYENIKPHDLKVQTIDDEKPAKAKLKADKVKSAIYLDTHTTISNIPPSAWDYKLGNRSALEWILDQYKEKKPKDPTIREKFNTYKFADYKERVIDLIKRVTTVSVRTVEIVKEMEHEQN